MNEIINLIKDTIIAPRQATKKIVSMRLSRNLILESLVFIVALSTLITFASLYMQVIATKRENMGSDPIFTIFSKFPLVLAITQFILILMFSGLITFVGRAFKGQGYFYDILKSVVWVNFILVLFNVFQLIVMLVSLGLSGLLGVLGTIWSMWAISAAAAEIHGFKSTFLTALGGGLIILILILVVGIFFQSFGFLVFRGVLDV